MRISDWSSDVCSSDLHVDMDGGMFRNAQEVGVQRTVGHGVESHILGEGADLLSAHFDEDDRIEEMAGAEQLVAELFLDMHRLLFFIVTLDECRYAALAAERAGGSLTSPPPGPGPPRVRQN